MSLILKKLDPVLSRVFDVSILSKNDREKIAYSRLLFPILLSIAFLSLNFLPNLFDPFSDELFVHSDFDGPIQLDEDKEFKIELSRRFNSTDAIVYYVRKHVPDDQNKKAQLDLLATIVRQRFFHAYGVYAMDENWIARFMGKFIWRDLAAKVIPDDILKGPVAACSQVSIVLMACCKELNIPYRKVGLNGHYAMEAMVNGRWYFVDANLKPDFSAIGGRKSLAEILANKEQFKLYGNTIMKDSAEIAMKFSKIEFGEVNLHPAPRAHVFHIVTKFLSKWLWIAPVLWMFLAFRKKS